VVELATVTAAPATGALLESVTCPAKAPVVSPCARTILPTPEKTTARSKRATNHDGFLPHGANPQCPLYFFQPGRTNLIMTSLAVTLPGTGVVCETRARRSLSFPRKRESTPQTLGNALSAGWIPAFAGMASVSKGIPAQMTPAPAFAGRNLFPLRLHRSLHSSISYS